MPTITVRVTASEKQFLKDMATIEGKDLSELMRTTTLENLEDKYDAIVVEKAYEKHLVDPVTVSHDDLMKELDI